MESSFENNVIKMGGVVASKLELSHEIYGEKFYRFYIEIDRLSSQKDRIPVIISERLIDVDDFEIGKVIFIEGQYRSYNKMDENNRSRLILSVFVKDIKQLEVSENVKTINELTITGIVCKKPIYRKTPLGRDIADILLAVNRSYNKSDYIPCIIWGRNAKYCEHLETGSIVKVVGRVQSREYDKKHEDGTIEKRTAYEVSVSKFEIIEKAKAQENEESVEE